MPLPILAWVALAAAGALVAKFGKNEDGSNSLAEKVGEIGVGMLDANRIERLLNLSPGDAMRAIEPELKRMSRQRFKNFRDLVFSAKWNMDVSDLHRERAAVLLDFIDAKYEEVKPAEGDEPRDD